MMQKSEFLKLFKTATLTAKSVRNNKSPMISECIDVINLLMEAPPSLVCEVLITDKIGKYFTVFNDHKNPKIQSKGKLLWSLWLTYLYAKGNKDNRRPVMRVKMSPITKKIGDTKKTGDNTRDKIREIVQKSLSKVATEVTEKEMKKRVDSCDPRIVAESVESAMYEKLGSFLGPQKPKYRSILFNLGDSKNPDFRRKVLIGIITGEKLMTMKREEMGSEKIQKEIQMIKEKAKVREEERSKMQLI